MATQTGYPACNTLSYLYQADSWPLEEVSSYNTYFNEGDVWPPQRISDETAELNQPYSVVGHTNTASVTLRPLGKFGMRNSSGKISITSTCGANETSDRSV